MALGRAVLIEGDAAHVNTDVPAIQAVTAADIQRVARRYLTDDTRVVIRYLPQSSAPPGEADVTSPAAPSAAVVAQALDAVAATPPPANLPHQAPAPTAPIAPQPPQVSERTLANGLRVIVAKTSDLPLITVQLTVRAGSAADPSGLAGLQSLTAAMLPQGSVHMTAPEIADSIEGLGGTLSAGAGADGSYLFLTVLADQLGGALPILADVAEHPAFSADELDRLRRQRLDEMTVQMQEPGGIASLVLGPVVFGATPYGHPAAGTPLSLTKITPADLARQYGQTFRPDNAILTLTGDITPEQGIAAAERAFGDWSRPSAPPTPRPAPAAPPRARVVVIDLPGTGQAAVVAAGRSIAYADPRLYAAQAANAVLGGGYSARLNEEVRVKRGLSYGAGSHLDPRRGAGLFVASAQTKNASAAEVADLILGQIKTLGQIPAPLQELDAREASLVGEFGRDTATSAGLASQLSTYALYGLDLDRLGLFTQRIQAITPADIPAGASALVDPSTLSLVIVGDAKLFLPALKAKYPKVEVVPASALDLDRASLTRER
jgi:zinc protease